MFKVKNELILCIAIGGLYAFGGVIYKKLITIHDEIKHFEGQQYISTKEEYGRKMKNYYNTVNYEEEEES